MHSKQIRTLVDQLDSLLGDTTAPETIERLANFLLVDSGPAIRQDDTAGSAPDSRWTTPEEIRVRVPLLSCSSRLPATVAARSYDSVRLSTSSLPGRFRSFFSERHLHSPPVRLEVSDASQLLTGFSASDSVRVCSAIHAAAIDNGFDSVHLLDIDLAGTPEQTSILPALGDILSSGEKGHVNINLGSSLHGVRADDLYAASLVALSLSEASARRSSFSVNAKRDRVAGCPSFSIVLSLWPLLDVLRTDVDPDTCYTDRSTVLGFAAGMIRSIGVRLLKELRSELSEVENLPETDRCMLSIDEPGRGPVSAGIWAGFPVDSLTRGSAGMLSARFLRSGLNTGNGSRLISDVLSDSLPLSDTVRNLIAIPEFMPPAMLAAFLAGSFSSSVSSRTGKWVRLIPVDQQPDRLGIYLPDVAGIVPLLSTSDPWLDGHFTCKGKIIPEQDF